MGEPLPCKFAHFCNTSFSKSVLLLTMLTLELVVLCALSALGDTWVITDVMIFTLFPHISHIPKLY